MWTWMHGFFRDNNWYNKQAMPHYSTNWMRWIGSIGLLLLGLNGCASQMTRPAAADPSSPPRPKVALVLGGGGAKGLAHVGVLQVLAEAHIRSDLVVGTSMGSVIGSLYASGQTPEQIKRTILRLQSRDLITISPSKQGLVSADKLRQFIDNQVDQRPIEHLPIAFAAVATELHGGKPAVFTHGDTGLAVQASSSVPNIFIPPRLVDPNAAMPDPVGRKYIDGGASSLVPVVAAKRLGADVIIAVDVLGADSSTTPHTFWQWLDQSANSNARSASQLAQLKQADVLIQPQVGQIASMDFSQRLRAIDAGKRAAQQQLPAIKRAITQAKQTRLSLSTLTSTALSAHAP